MKCKIKGCEADAIAKGLCSKHNMRLRKHGKADVVEKRGRKPAKRVTIEKFLEMLIDREFSKRPFTVKDVVKRYMTNRDGDVAAGRFPSYRKANFDGKTYMVEIASEFEQLMQLTVDVLRDKLDKKGHPVFLHTPPPRHRETDEDGSYWEVDDFEAATFFHRDIATPEQEIAYGKWLEAIGREDYRL